VLATDDAVKVVAPQRGKNTLFALLRTSVPKHYNIRHTQRGWLAFDPKGVVGERSYDCANTLCNPVMPELVHNETRLLRNAAILADILALDLERVLAFTYIYACLNACWWLELSSMEKAEEIVRWHLRVAAIIEPHLDMW